MANLTIQKVDRDGLVPTFDAADAAGDAFPNDDRTVLVVKNGDTVAHTVTLAAQKTVLYRDGFGEIPIADLAVTVAAGGEAYVQAPPASHNDPSGKVQVTYDAVTSVTVAAIRIPNA